MKIQQVHKKKTELGIGQTSIVPHRYKLIDYLPSMFFYKFLVQSKKPEAVSSLATLIYPFDKYCWYLLIASILATFIALLSIQKCWMVASGERPSNIWIFEGHWKFQYFCISWDSSKHNYLFRFCPCSNSSYWWNYPL